MIKKKIVSMLSHMELAKGADVELIGRLESSLHFSFPTDFEAFLMFSNGARGELGADYIELWSVEEILEFNDAMEVQTNAPGLIAFGCDGANELYAYDSNVSPATVVQVPMIGMGLEAVWYCSDTFENFLSSKSGTTDSE